jgi:hypothetical protein
MKPYVSVELASTEEIVLNHCTVQHGKIIRQQSFLPRKDNNR